MAHRKVILVDSNYFLASFVSIDAKNKGYLDKFLLLKYHQQFTLTKKLTLNPVEGSRSANTRNQQGLELKIKIWVFESTPEKFK